ncbi:MAG: hypothetical protein ABFC84_01720 [Veillonellales bacterium]
MGWYILGFVLSVIVFAVGKDLGIPPVLKWLIIGLIWGGAVHMAMRGQEGGYRKKKSSR